MFEFRDEILTIINYLVMLNKLEVLVNLHEPSRLPKAMGRFF